MPKLKDLKDLVRHEYTKVTEKPQCDWCYLTRKASHPAIVDGKTTHGPWGYMCKTAFEENGVGLGLGRGQVLLTEDEIKEHNLPML